MGTDTVSGQAVIPKKKQKNKTQPCNKDDEAFFFFQVSQKGENQLPLEVSSTAVQLAVLAAPPPSGHYPNDGFTFDNKTNKKKRLHGVLH